VIRDVAIADAAKKALRKVPVHIARKLQQWVDDVEESGLEEVRKRAGWHDEPLHGKRHGQRSIRLNQAYRAIYELVRGRVEFVLIQEVSKHDY